MTCTQYRLASCGRSDIGLCREQNEDVWNSLEALGFFVLADGMGGHPAGEIAARAAVTSLCDYLDAYFEAPLSPSVSELCALFIELYTRANLAVYDLAHRHTAYHGMGTTLSTLFFHDEAAIYSHVGDSRIYRLRGDSFIQLTTDHVKERHKLTRAIGPYRSVIPEIGSASLEQGDTFLICSDGLTGAISDTAIAAILRTHPAPDLAASALIDAAKGAGGRDNITAVVVHVSR